MLSGNELWRNCGLLSDEIGPRSRHVSFEHSYLLADGTLTLASDDRGLSQRFDDVYGDCAGTSQGPSLQCSVVTHPNLPLVRVSFGEPVADLVRFVSYVFPERGFAAAGQSDNGWTLLTRDGLPFAAVADDGTLLLEKSSGWQSFAGNIAVNLLLRLQANLLFFHGATCDVGGRGVMFTGPKAAGKTTTSLALAARGHALLGDEIAAIRRETWEAVPFLRALSIRDGLRAPGIAAALAAIDAPQEIFPDGQPRLRVRASELFARVPHPVPLRAAFFLRGFAPEPRIEPVARSVASLRLLQPLGCTLWNNASTGSTMDLLRFFEKTACYHLDAGAPDDTATAIEQCVLQHSEEA